MTKIEYLKCQEEKKKAYKKIPIRLSADIWGQGSVGGGNNIISKELKSDI